MISKTLRVSWSNPYAMVKFYMEILATDFWGQVTARLRGLSGQSKCEMFTDGKLTKWWFMKASVVNELFQNWCRIRVIVGWDYIHWMQTGVQTIILIIMTNPKQIIFKGLIYCGNGSVWKWGAPWYCQFPWTFGGRIPFPDEPEYHIKIYRVG
jgi:hypothetical protein